MTLSYEDRLQIETEEDARIIVDFAFSCVGTIDGAEQIALAVEPLKTLDPTDFPVDISSLVDITQVLDPDKVVRTILKETHERAETEGDIATSSLSQALYSEANPYKAAA